jgi:hypothetical protein
MNRVIYLVYCFVISTATFGATMAAAEDNLEEAVKTALNGNLNPDHVGPDRATQLQTLLANNAKSANAILLNVLNSTRPGPRAEDLYVVEVLKFTKSDVSGAAQVTHKYLTLVDAADAAEKARHAAAAPDNTEQERFKNRINRIETARSGALAFLRGIGK